MNRHALQFNYFKIKIRNQNLSKYRDTRNYHVAIHSDVKLSFSLTNLISFVNRILTDIQTGLKV